MLHQAALVHSETQTLILCAYSTAVLLCCGCWSSLALGHLSAKLDDLGAKRGC
jgi:hypothetical protein